MKKNAKSVNWLVYILILCASLSSSTVIFWGCAVDDHANLPAKIIHKSDDSATGKVKLACENVPAADSYNLYISKVPGAKSTGKQIINASNPITITELAIETTYYFVVTTVENGLESAPSNELSFYVEK